MLVEEIMKTNVVTCHQDKSMHHALKLMKINKIRHLPIIDDHHEIVGIIAERNIKDALPPTPEKSDEEAFFSQPVANIMIKNIITAHPLDFVEDLAAVLYEHKIGCIPIVEDKQLIGLVTETDMLYTLVQLTGANQASSLIEVQVDHISGKLADVAQIISKHNVNIISVLVYPNENKNMKTLIFRIQTMNPTNVIQSLREDGYHVRWPNIPGISE